MRAKPLKPLIYEMLEERQGNPIISIEVSMRAGVKRMSGWQCLHRMLAKGEIYALPVGHDYLYFRNSTDADRYSRKEIAAFAERQAKVRSERLAESNRRRGGKVKAIKAKPALEPGVTIKVRKSEPIEADFSKAKITRAVTPPDRFAPDADYRGPFSLAGIGRDVETGRGWA